MNNDALIKLQRAFSDRAITRQELESFEKEHGYELEEDWLEFAEDEDCYYLTPEILEYQKPSQERYEALGLGELEERIVGVLEQGKSIPWGKVAVAMWLFFLFIVVYTIVETLFQIHFPVQATNKKKPPLAVVFCFREIKIYLARSL